MKKYLALLLVSMLCALAHADGRAANEQIVRRWYEAFDKKTPSLFDRIIDDAWVDIPSPEGIPPGPEGLKKTYAMLTTTFPDLKVTIKEILQDGNKVVVRSEIAGTQRTTFVGVPSKDRRMTIQAVDIHEVRGGKIVRTWHTEDWMTGLHQLGALGK